MRRMLLLTGGVFLLLFSMTGVRAQSGGGPDANMAFQLKIGAFLPSGGGQVWDENEDVFTMQVSDFNDLAWGMSFLYLIDNNLELGLNADFYSTTVFSSYEPSIVVDENGFPINHDTRLEETPLTVDLRWMPAGRYRLRGQGRAVVRPVFYVGGGLGALFWDYREVGDFVDFSDPALPIFYADFRDSGTTLQLHALAGLEVPLSRRSSLLFEGKYTWAEDTVRGLGSLELGGAWLYVGGSWRF